MKTFRVQMIFAVLLVLYIGGGCARKQATGNADELVKEGWSNYRLGEFDRAIAQFDSATQVAAADSPAYLQALYGLGTTWNLRRPGNDPDKARQYFEEILKRDPQGELVPWTLLALARMQHLVPVGEDPNYDEVRKAYQEIMDRYPGHLAAKESLIYLNATLLATLQEKEIRQAVAALEKFVAENPTGEFVNPAYSLLAVAYMTLKEPDKRLQAEIKALETTEVDPANPFTEFGWAYWNIAAIAEFEVGDLATARKYYTRLITEYPRDQKVFGAKQALRRMDELEARIKAEEGHL